MIPTTRYDSMTHDELIAELSEQRHLRQEAEQRFLLLVQNLPDVIYLLDEEGTIRFISAAVTTYGYSPEELIGTSIFDIVHPEDRERARFRLNERRRGDRRTTSLVVRLLNRHRESLPVEMRSRSVIGDIPVAISAEGCYEAEDERSERFVGTLGVARDMAGRAETGSGVVPGSLIPVCAACKQIRTSEGIWESFEQFFISRLGVSFSHSICPECISQLYPSLRDVKSEFSSDATHTE